MKRDSIFIQLYRFSLSLSLPMCAIFLRFERSPKSSQKKGPPLCACVSVI